MKNIIDLRKNSHNLNHIRIKHCKEVTNCINNKNPNKIILCFNHLKIPNTLNNTHLINKIKKIL